MGTTDIERLRESRETLDELLTVIYRLRDIDRDTADMELGLQELIEYEFSEMDEAIGRLETAQEDL